MAHLENQIRKPHLLSDSTLHIVGVISNPARYHSRYRLYRKWAEAMNRFPNVKFYTVEAAFGDRHHEITESHNHKHLQVRIKSEIWVKENLINLGVKHLLPRDWRYMAWVDCDVFFRNPDFALEAVHQLQHFPVIQPWQTCLDLGFSGHGMTNFNSFGYQSSLGGPMRKKSSDPYPYGHCGFAWACRRDFWESVGGLLEIGILGSGDHHMAWAMVGGVADTVPQGVGSSYLGECLRWQTNAMKVTKKEVGFSSGRIEHEFHGPKKRRYYQERWKILMQNHFDPVRDLIHDAQGVLRLNGKPELEIAVRKYNRSRLEDSIED